MHQLSSPEQWLSRYGDVLYRYGLVRVHHPEIAEDLVQETLLAALKGQKNFQGQSSEQTWLVGILKHKIIDFFRRTARQSQHEVSQMVNNHQDDYFDDQGKWNVDLSPLSTPDQSMEQVQFLETLQSCVEKLPSRMAQLFTLREFDDLKTEEICQIMSISNANLWVILSRARLQLRHCLEISWIKPL